LPHWMSGAKRKSAHRIPKKPNNENVDLHSELSFADSLKSAQRTAFYERHKPIAVVMILIVFLLPIAGVFVMGMPGGVLGVIVSVAGYFVTPFVVLKLRGLF